jgi:hypothetical protein
MRALVCVCGYVGGWGRGGVRWAGWKAATAGCVLLPAAGARRFGTGEGQDRTGWRRGDRRGGVGGGAGKRVPDECGRAPVEAPTATMQARWPSNGRAPGRSLKLMSPACKRSHHGAETRPFKRRAYPSKKRSKAHRGLGN